MSNRAGEGCVGRPKRKSAITPSQETPPVTRKKADLEHEERKLSLLETVKEDVNLNENEPTQEQQHAGSGGPTIVLRDGQSADYWEKEQIYGVAFLELKTREVEWALSLTNIVKCDREIQTREAELFGALTALERAKADSNQRLSRHDERLATLRTKRETMERELGDIRLEYRNRQDAKILELERVGEEKNSRIFELEINLAKSQQLVEAEREKRMCQICMTNTRDALVLPCMHFLYCSDCIHIHQKTSKECPTCRGPISASMHCKLNLDG